MNLENAIGTLLEIKEDFDDCLKHKSIRTNEEINLANKYKEAIETVLQSLEDKEKIIDRMIDYIMIHQQVKTMKKIFCKHCEINKDCAYSGIHRDCIKRYFDM